MPSLCRDCFTIAAQDPDERCARCRSPRLIAHPELEALSIAHVDCDAFFASVEKRDDPSLADVPVIIGGGRRGVVSTCCYLARIHGVHSAMPMFKALKACPDAVVIRPNFEKYVTAGREVRSRMQALTPLVQPLSIDEAFLDLSGTTRVHRAPPAATLARFARDVEANVGITVSIGLAPNKFLAKFASDADKPRGYTVVGQGDAVARLSREPVTRLPGVGPAAASRLARAGVTHVRDLQRLSMEDLMRRIGSDAPRLHRLANGIDTRAVDPSSERKSVSAEQTFDADLVGPADAPRAPAAPLRKGLDPAEGERDRRPHHHAEAEDAGLPQPHPRRDADGADRHGTPHLHRRQGAPPRRAGGHALPPHRHRRHPPHQRQGGRRRGPLRPARHPPRPGRARDGCPACEVRRRRDRDGPLPVPPETQTSIPQGPLSVLLRSCSSSRL